MWVRRNGHAVFGFGELQKSKYVRKSHARLNVMKGREALQRLIDFESVYKRYL